MQEPPPVLPPIPEGLDPGQSPLTMLMAGRQIMAHPVFDHELDVIRNSSIFGGLSAGLAFFFLSAFLNYSIALETSGVALDARMAGRYDAYATVCFHLSYIVGLLAIILQIRVASKVRAVKRITSTFVWSETEKRWVRADPDPEPRGLGLWPKLKRKVRTKVDKFVS